VIVHRGYTSYDRIRKGKRYTIKVKAMLGGKNSLRNGAESRYLIVQKAVRLCIGLDLPALQHGLVRQVALVHSQYLH